MVDLNSPFLVAADLSELLDLQKDACYKIIRKFNEELAEKGFYTVKGRIATKYFCKRMGIDRK